MSVFTYSTFTAVMSFVALALAAAALAVRVGAPQAVRTSLADPARWLAWLVAVSAMVGSLIYSEYYGFEPCVLCWYQRIAMYPLAFILLVGSIRRERATALFGLPLSIVGLGISIYHVLIQNLPALDAGACDPNNPCSAKYVDMFGFVSIPFMAGAGFLLITILLASFAAAPDPTTSSK